MKLVGITVTQVIDHIQWDRKPQIIGDYMTCMAMFTNGAKTIIIKTTTLPVEIAQIQQDQKAEVIVFFEVDILVIIPRHVVLHLDTIVTQDLLILASALFWCGNNKRLKAFCWSDW